MIARYGGNHKKTKEREIKSVANGLKESETHLAVQSVLPCTPILVLSACAADGWYEVPRCAKVDVFQEA